MFKIPRFESLLEKAFRLANSRLKAGLRALDSERNSTL